MKFIQGMLIFALSITAAVVYGILHDQITVRICLEYFTIGHPPIFNTQNPTLLALGWGVIATWWVGAILGFPLALAAQVGRQPARSASSLLFPIFMLLIVMGLCAGLAGTLSYFHFAPRARVGALFDPLASGIPAEKQLAFLIDLWSHIASYLSGFVGGLLLIAWVLVSRYHKSVAQELAQRPKLGPSYT